MAEQLPEQPRHEGAHDAAHDPLFTIGLRMGEHSAQLREHRGLIDTLFHRVDGIDEHLTQQDEKLDILVARTERTDGARRLLGQGLIAVIVALLGALAYFVVQDWTPQGRLEAWVGLALVVVIGALIHYSRFTRR